MVRRDGHALEDDQRLDPLGRPSAISLARKFREGTEGESPLPCSGADVVVIAADGERQRQHRPALVEGEDLRAVVATELRGDEGE